jgi:hypothetical protein
MTRSRPVTTSKALIAHFSGTFGISTTMRAHEGIGIAQAH